MTSPSVVLSVPASAATRALPWLAITGYRSTVSPASQYPSPLPTRPLPLSDTVTERSPSASAALATASTVPR